MPRRSFCPLIACAAMIASTHAVAEEAPKPVRHPIARSDSPSRSGASTASGGSTLVTLGVGVALAAFGAVAWLARRGRPVAGTANLRVVGRASLSPRQAVCLVRVGERTLILGTGGQGPPSLLGELKPGEPIEPAPVPPAPHHVRAGGAA